MGGNCSLEKFNALKQVFLKTSDSAVWTESRKPAAILLLLSGENETLLIPHEEKPADADEAPISASTVFGHCRLRGCGSSDEFAAVRESSRGEECRVS